MMGRRNTARQMSPFVIARKIHRLFTSTSTHPLQIGILRETYDKWERRAPLCPEHVKSFLDHHPQCSVIVQPSSNRIFGSQEYEQAGARVQDDLSGADVILGVKRPISMVDLPGGKTYMFFSHVIKGQPENLSLLQECLDKKIHLIDYECIVQNDATQNSRKQGKRLIAFGEYAGLAGMVDTFPVLGRRLLMKHWSTPFMNCPPAIHHYDVTEVKRSVDHLGERLRADGLPLDLEPLVFTMTGKGGNVYNGVRELFDILPHEIVDVKDLPEVQRLQGPQYKVYGVAPEKDEIYQRLDGGGFDRSDYMKSPHLYKSVFAGKIAPYSHVILNCGYWDYRFPRLLTKDDIQDLYENGNERLLVVTDISCDVGGSLEFLDRSTTIDRPAYQYDPFQGREISDHIGDYGVTMLGVDILPTELPADSSRHFGNILSGLLEEFLLALHESSGKLDTTKLTQNLKDAAITTVDGELAPGYHYLTSIMKHTNEQDVSTTPSKQMILLLEGHLFDSGLINQVLDLIEKYDCSFEFQECLVSRRKKDEAPLKSSAVLKVTGSLEVDFSTVAKKIHDLFGVIETADATCKVFDENHKPAYVQDPDDKTILLLGSGLVSKSVVDLLGRSKDRTMIVASNDEEDARSIAQVARRGRHTFLDIKNDTRRLIDLVKRSDVVISLLPAPMHPQIAEHCIKHRKNLVTASYESNAMRELREAAENAGIIVLNEVGLDPGLDHMSAMRLIHDIQERGGNVTSFRSVCGGLPSPEAADNPLKYKFSWNPRGVISASQNPAQYRHGNVTVEVDGKGLLQSATPFTADVWPELQLECLPNRDSLVYETIYGIEGADSIFRGTLRYEGFSNLMHVFRNMGLFESEAFHSATWGDTLQLLKDFRGSKAETMESFLLECAGGDVDLAARAMQSLHWMGMTCQSDALDSSAPVVDLFCAKLEDKLQYEKSERDMVVMHHCISAHFDDGRTEEHHSSLRTFGDGSMSAMCKTVGYPTAAVTDLVLSGALASRAGLLLPTSKDIYEPTLEAMEREGIVFDEKVFVSTDPHPEYA